MTFKTRGRHVSFSPYGTASVSAGRLTVRGGSVSLRVSCSGARGAMCGGIVLLAARGQICGGGTFSVRAGGAYEVQSDLSASCRALLRAAPATGSRRSSAATSPRTRRRCGPV